MPASRKRTAATLVREADFSGGRSPSALVSRLGAQQISLIRSVLAGQPDYINRSFSVDPTTGQRSVDSLEERELSTFLSRWADDPLACIRSVNETLGSLDDPLRLTRYIEAAVDLEILLDRALRRTDTRVRTGIEGYLADGYTDMGSNASLTDRRDREKIRVDKKNLRARLVELRRHAVEIGPTLKLLARYYEWVRADLEFDEAATTDLARAHGDRSVLLSRFLEKGAGVCRHLAILYQLCLQEAGVPSRLVKGEHRLFAFGGRHAWNVAWLSGRTVLVDVTLPSGGEAFILTGDSLGDVYEEASTKHHRSYRPSTNSDSFHRIRAQ